MSPCTHAHCTIVLHVQVSAALALWDSSCPHGSFVFTSSMGVCSVEDGSEVREDCPVVGKGSSPSQEKILAAEEAVMKVSPCVRAVATEWMQV